MGSLRDDRDDTDNEEMEHDSADSDKSSSTSDTSDSDSDDSSELDGEECERRRNDLLETIADLEKQFSLLREQLYTERIVQIKRKLKEVENGEAEEYRLPLQELQDNMRVRIEVAETLRKLKLDNIYNIYKAEEQAARQNYENERRLLFDGMKEELEEKIRKLEEDGTCEMQVDWIAENNFNPVKPASKGTAKQVKKGSKVVETSSRRKPVTVTGPYIVYMLSEEDILEDWSIIKKALSTKRNNENKGEFLT